MNIPFWLDTIPAPILNYSSAVRVCHDDENFDITLLRFHLESGKANANARM